MSNFSSYHYWIVAYPDISKPIGGIKQLHRVCEIIQLLGRQCTLIQGHGDFHPDWFESNVSTISRDDFFSSVNLKPSVDRIILPETYVPIIDSIVDPRIPRIIFNQNGSYTFGLDGKSTFDPNLVLNAYRNKSLSQVWCVSYHDYNFLVRGLGLPNKIVRLISNAVDIPRYELPLRKKKQIVFMPRKNRRDSLIVEALFSNSSLSRSWNLRPLTQLPHHEVISAMKESLIYLSFGHPEGFGLPVAEAMACGCSVIGYSGLGGRELFNHYLAQDLNYEVSYGDWLGFISSLHDFDAKLALNKSDILDSLLLNASRILNDYSLDSMISSLRDSLSLIE